MERWAFFDERLAGWYEADHTTFDVHSDAREEPDQPAIESIRVVLD